MSTPEKYRDWLIEENWIGWWEATHPDYDGPEDNRHVTGKTCGEVIDEINNWISENEA